MTSSPSVLNACDASHCITCGDDGEPMSVLAVDAPRGLALCVGEQDERVSVEIALLAPVRIGERLLVHAGTAIARLDSAAECAS